MDNSIPVGLSVRPRPSLGGLAVSLSSALGTRPHPVSQVAWAPVVISVYRENRSKLGSISALASCFSRTFPAGKARRNSGRIHLCPFPTPQRRVRSGKRKRVWEGGAPGLGDPAVLHPRTSRAPRTSIPRPRSRAHVPGDVPTLGEQPEAGSQGRQLPSGGPGVETSFTGVSPPQQTAMTPKPAGPPDGGWGWVVAAAAFAVNGLSYGLLRSLGLALPDLAEHFERSAQDTAWVSALALAVQQAASEGGPPRWEAGMGWRGRGCSDGRTADSITDNLVAPRSRRVGLEVNGRRSCQARQEPMKSVGDSLGVPGACLR